MWYIHILPYHTPKLHETPGFLVCDAKLHGFEHDATWVLGCVMWMWVIWPVRCPQSHRPTQPPSAATASINVYNHAIPSTLYVTLHI